MRAISRLLLLSGCSLALAACADQPLQPLAELPPSLLTGGGCYPPDVAEIAPPLVADGSAVFQIPSTIPLKIRVTNCETGAEDNT
ncbi:MAG TPA: hypothetical protein VGQ73_08850, partial [Gemmatimonadales bacterium]|nr:hypothetical protein [Gemmatimonadales bacterium]